MLNNSRFILWGSSGHAKVLASLIELQGGTVVAIFDNSSEAVSVLPSVPLYIGIDGFKRWIEGEGNPSSLNGLPAIGGSRGRDRIAIHRRFSAYGIQLSSLIHPTASVCASALLGAGVQVLAQTVVAADTEIGEGCIVNHRAAADHECVLGSGVHLAPGATLCGCVTIGNNVMIGAGAVVLPRLTIGNDSIIGAGAIVTRDIPEGVVVIGNPARIVRMNSVNELQARD